jgi:hypothetical protein
LATHLVRKAAYSLILAVLLAVLAALQDATTNLGWLLSFAMQSMLMWMLFLHRNQLAGQLIAAVSGQQPAREAQLRKLLGVAYLARQINPARRRTRPRPQTAADAADPEPGEDQSGDQEPPTGPSAGLDAPIEPGPPNPATSRPPVVATHGRPSARRDHGGARPAARDTQPLKDSPDQRAATDEPESPAATQAPAATPPRRSRPYARTDAELYRNDEGHEVWRITGPDGTAIAQDVASDREMTWLRDYHEHEHLGDVAATAAADQLKYQDEADSRLRSGPHRSPAERSYTRTETELYRNAQGHEVWRITDADGTVIAHDISSDHDMQWMRDYHEHAHLGDNEAAAIADRREHEAPREVPETRA